MLNKTLEWIHTYTGFSTDLTFKIIESLSFILAVYLLRKIIVYTIKKSGKQPTTVFRLSRTLYYLSLFFLLIILGKIWIRDFQSLFTFFGLLSAGLAIAFKDPLINLGAWIYMTIRNTFDIGDRIEIGGIRGDIVNMDLFELTLMEIGNWVDADQSTGRIIHIPNGKIFSEPFSLFNRGFKYIWTEIPVLITFESDWKKTKVILNEVLDIFVEKYGVPSTADLLEKKERYLIHFSKTTPIVYTTARDSGVELTLRFLCDPKQRRTCEEFIWEEILDRFSEHSDINLAYPSYKLFTEVEKG